ncbi:MAG: matrixin family metalloprotease [Bacillota bacterium]
MILLLASCQKDNLLGPGDENHLASEAQESCGFVQNVYGARVSWKNKLPIQLYIANDFPPEYEPSLRSAAHTWEEAAGMTLFNISEGSTDSTSSAKNGTNLVSWNSTWDESKKDLQAVTSLYWNGTQINEADLAVDARYFSYFTDQPEANTDQVHLQSLLLHELGHVLGLKHRNVLPTVMWPILDSSIKRDSLSDSDIKSLKCEY